MQAKWRLLTLLDRSDWVGCRLRIDVVVHGVVHRVVVCDVSTEAEVEIGVGVDDVLSIGHSTDAKGYDSNLPSEEDLQEARNAT